MNRGTGIKRGVVFLAAEKGVNGIIAILLIPVMIQRIGVENYGLWGILLGLAAYIQCLDFGIMYSIERFVAHYLANNDKKYLSDFLSTALTMFLLISIAILLPMVLWGGQVIGFLTKGSLEVDGRAVILSMYPVIVMTWIIFVFAGVTRGQQRFDISSKIQMAGKLLFAGVLIALLYRNQTVFAAIYAYNAQCFLLLVCYFYFARKLLPDVHFLRLSLSPPMLRHMIGFSYKLQISALSSQVNQQFDKFLLASFSNLAVVGYYDAAARIVYAIKDIPLFLFSVLIPQVSALAAGGNREEIRDLFFKVTALLAITGFAITGLLVLNSEYIIGFVLKKEANAFSIMVFNVLCITMVWQSMAAGAAYVARGMGMTFIEMRTAIIVLVVNVTASYTFIRFFDIKGVVFGTALSSVIAPAVCYVMVCKEFSCGFMLFMRRFFAVPLTGFFLIGAVCWILKQYLPSSFAWWLNVLVSGIAFTGLTHLFYLILRYRPYYELLESLVVMIKGRMSRG
jgi:O-antigen/teichoic acid export membrane protein